MPEPAGAALLSRLQGKYKCVYSEIDGNITPANEFATTTIEFKGNAFSIEKNGLVAHEGIFTINPSANPCQMVLIYSKSIPIFLGGPRAGIFQLEGDTLKLCFGAVGYPPPQTFNTTPGSETVLTVYQRIGAVAALGSTKSITASVSVW